MGRVRLRRLASFVQQHPAALAACIIASATCALYLPFLANPFVFDDKGHFTGSRFADYATFPFGWEPRFPASFSVAVIHVLFGSVEAHRIVSLVLHALVGCAVFLLVRQLQRAASTGIEGGPARAGAALAAGLFIALHPVAVYGAAYLAQRSIVLATLFSVLSAALFVHGLTTGRYAAAVGAAVLYSLAVLCKEQAILVVAAVPLIACMVTVQRRFAVRYTLLYVAACIPAAIFIYLLLKGVVGAAYEAREALPAEKASVAVPSAWLASVLTQLGLFPRYVALWLAPDTGRMSFDLRVDFAAAQAPLTALASLLAFIATGFAGAWLLWRRGRLAVIGFGILWFWLLYLIEFTVARFQEPFVLYRSYLWAPGIAVALAAFVERCPPRLLATGAAALLLGLGWLAHERLGTFTSGYLLWQDAVAKLPAQPVPGGSRTLYQLGREYFYAGEAQKARDVVERCIAQYPGTHQCLFAQSAMLLVAEEYEAALPYLARAVAARPTDAVTRHHLGLALQGLGCRQQAKAQYELSAKLGFWGGVERLKSLDGTGGILPASHERKPSPGFRCSEALKGFAEPGR
jgi:tetratricopeptide (TPR) repeat protein